jgi:glycosyltransferase involved in cell wall biosynthesis
MTTMPQRIHPGISQHQVDKVALTVIVPCFNEEEGIVACHNRPSAVLQQTGLNYEILYVDDGSRDRTLQILTQLYS